jgi:hypothetical protein
MKHYYLKETRHNHGYEIVKALPEAHCQGLIPQVSQVVSYGLKNFGYDMTPSNGKRLEESCTLYRIQSHRS